LTERQKEVLKKITTRPTISRKALALELGGINESSVQKQVKALKRKRAIERIGSNTKGYWEMLINE
jgi:predicted HTH transcriptional regulator